MSEKPYRVAFGYCNQDHQDFATFAEALAFYETNPGGRWGESVYNTDRMDGGEFDGESGDELVSSGLTEEENEQLC